MNLEILIKDFFENVPIEQLIKIYNINYSRICNTVKQYCLLNNIDFKKIQERLELPMSTIYKARKNGISFNQLANEYRCTPKLIKDKLINYCNNNNLEIPDTENINPILGEEIYIKRKNGVSYNDLVNEYSYPKITIQNHLREYCKNNNLEYPIFDDFKEEITPEEAYNEKKLGKSYMDIAKEYGYNFHIIRNYIIDFCKKNNLEIPKYKKTCSLPLEEMYIKRKNGVSYNDLVNEYGYPKITIQNHLREYCKNNNLEYPIFDDFKDEITPEEAYNEKKLGRSYMDIAKEYGYNFHIIRNYIIDFCKKNNLEIPKYKKIVSLPLEEIYIKRKNGVSYNDLVNEYGYPKITIQNHLREYCKNNNLEYPILNNFKDEITPEEAYNEKKLGKSYTDIAEEYGYSSSIIRKFVIEHCTKNNLEIPKYQKVISLPIEEIYKKRKNGMSYNVLAKEYGHSREYIRKKLIKYCEEKNINLSILSGNLITEQFFIDIKNGLRYDELTKKYDCTVTEINDNIINSCSNEIIRLNNILKKEYQIKLLLDLKAILLKAQNNISKEENSITIGKTLSFKTDKIKKKI